MWCKRRNMRIKIIASNKSTPLAFVQTLFSGFTSLPVCECSTHSPQQLPCFWKIDTRCSYKLSVYSKSDAFTGPESYIALSRSHNTEHLDPNTTISQRLALDQLIRRGANSILICTQRAQHICRVLGRVTLESQRRFCA